MMIRHTVGRKIKRDLPVAYTIFFGVSEYEGCALLTSTRVTEHQRAGQAYATQAAALHGRATSCPNARPATNRNQPAFAAT